jgi:SAM-dependent methyltransferase
VPDLPPEVLAHYERDSEERIRLTAGHGVLEFLRTQELLARCLPPPPARILDVGGAAGIHALPLAARGYDVDVVDPVDLHVRQARDASAASPAPLRSAEVGDARALTAADGTIDAVLELGPLYHLVERAERLAALREARRVLRPGGVVAAAIISRFASTADGLRFGLLDEPGFEEVVERDLREGAHLVPEHRPELFTTTHFHWPDEACGELRDAGFADVAAFAIEGIAPWVTDVPAWLGEPARRERLLAAIRRVESVPALLAASPHVLVVGRAP